MKAAKVVEWQELKMIVLAASVSDKVEANLLSKYAFSHVHPASKYVEHFNIAKANREGSDVGLRYQTAQARAISETYW